MIMIIHNHHVRLSLQLWPRQQWGWSLHGALCAHGERLGFARRGEPRDDAGDPWGTWRWSQQGLGCETWQFPEQLEISMGNYFWFVPHLPVEGLQILSEWALADLNGERQMSDRMPQKTQRWIYIPDRMSEYVYVYIYIYIFIYLYIR